MPPKKQVIVSPLDTRMEKSPDPEPAEELEVQIKQARQRNVPGHVENGKRMQSKGVEARKQNGYASQREKKLAAEQKKNDRLERMRKIEAAEEAEKERSRRLAGDLADKERAPSPKAETVAAGGDYDKRLQRIEELLIAREAPAKPKAKPRARKVVAESDSEEEPPERQKHVRKSAKTEMRKKAGAMEEDIHRRGHLPDNTNMQKVMAMDQRDRFEAMARNLFPR